MHISESKNLNQHFSLPGIWYRCYRLNNTKTKQPHGLTMSMIELPIDSRAYMHTSVVSTLGYLKETVLNSSIRFGFRKLDSSRTRMNWMLTNQSKMHKNQFKSSTSLFSGTRVRYAAWDVASEWTATFSVYTYIVRHSKV